jgi:hypothetical protein
VEGWEVVFVNGNRSSGTGAEELGFGLKVVKMMLGFCNSTSRKGGDNASEVVVGANGETKWITKEACASGGFGRGVTRILCIVSGKERCQWWTCKEVSFS